MKLLEEFPFAAIRRNVIFTLAGISGLFHDRSLQPISVNPEGYQKLKRVKGWKLTVSYFIIANAFLFIFLSRDYSSNVFRIKKGFRSGPMK